MSKERVEQVEGAGASVPMTDISNIDVPEAPMSSAAAPAAHGATA